MKRLDFPVEPYILKYLQVHLKLEPLAEAEDGALVLSDYVLSKTNRFGFALYQLLQRQAQSARHESSVEKCTARLGVDLRNFNYKHYGLHKLSAYTIFQFNDVVDDGFRADLYRIVKEQVQRRSTIKDAIRFFMALYDLTEDDIAYETLRKDVQRNVDLQVKKKPGKIQKNFPMNLSQKTGGSSQKTGEVSRKIGVLSHKDAFRAVRQQLAKMPIPLFDLDFIGSYAS